MRRISCLDRLFGMGVLRAVSCGIGVLRGGGSILKLMALSHRF